MSQPRGARWTLAMKIAGLALLVQLTLVAAILLTVQLDLGRPGPQALAVIAGLMSLPVFVTYFVTRFVVSRLTVPVIQAYRRVAAGDFDATLPTITAGRDFLELRHGFSAMAEALRRLLDEVRGADAERRRLFADLAHELANPTCTLLGITEALRHHQGDPERLVALLEGEVLRLEHLVADIRELTTLEDPALPLVCGDVDVVALAEAATARMPMVAPATRVSVESVSRPIMATLDAARVELLLGNLLSNAARHAAGAPVRVCISQDDTQVTLAVEDGGPGVPDDVLPELGRRLFRVERSRDRVSGGHGLGLSLARAVAHRHGGTITFSRSTLGGLAVSVALPRTPLDDEPGSGARERERARAVAFPTGR